MATKKEKTDTIKTEPAKPTQIFDVAKPGTLPPADATSRPVIVMNRAVMQDPMMVPKTATDLPPTDPNNQKISTKIVLKPVEVPSEPVADGDSDGVVDSTEKPANGSTSSKFFKPLTDTVVTKPVESTTSVAATPVSTASPTPAATPAKTTAAPASSPETISNSSVPSDVDSQDGDTPLDADKNQDKEAAEMEAAAKAQDELDTLVNDKTYFLDINSIERRRSMHVFVYGLLLILILIFAWINIALDAGLIQIDGFKALTHFFDTP